MIKDRIVEILKERGEVNLTHFFHLIPEIKGEYEMYAPLKEPYNPNIMLISGVSQEFIQAFSDLNQAKEIEVTPVDIMIFMFDGSPIYHMKLFQKRHFKTKTVCWQPVSISLSKTK